MTILPPAIRALYPFESRFLDLDGVRLHYVDEGTGPAVLMLHGNPTWSFYYRNLIAALRTTHRVIAPDHIGCGLSDKPQRYPYVLRQHIHNIERLIDHLDLHRITLVVHDWGGAIGFGVAQRRPDRFKTGLDRFQRFILFNTAAFFGKIPWRIRLCRTPLLGPCAVRVGNLFARSAIVMACNRPLPADVRQGLLFPYNSYANRIATLRFVQDIPTNPSHPSYALMNDIQESLAQFKHHPMTILWGDRDFCFNNQFLQQWQLRFPRAIVHRFADAGHYVLEDAHERIVPIVQSFLETPIPSFDEHTAKGHAVQP